MGAALVDRAFWDSEKVWPGESFAVGVNLTLGDLVGLRSSMIFMTSRKPLMLTG